MTELVEFELTDDSPRIIVREMLTISRATDLFLEDLLRRGYSQSTIQKYGLYLDKLADSVRTDLDVGQVTQEDCMRFLDGWNNRSPNTRALVDSAVRSFYKWLYNQQKVKRNPMERVVKPKRTPSEYLDVTTVEPDEVQKMLAACETWTEKLALHILAYTGARRHAVSALRLKDFDQIKSTLKFFEKGSKTIKKPVPEELHALISEAIDAGLYSSPDDYLVPSEGPRNRTGERDDRLILHVVRRVSKRCGVKAHTHSFRAAFACFYLKQTDNDVLSLKDLMGHGSLETTMIYLRRRQKEDSMEKVRSLSWSLSSSVQQQQG